VRQINYRHLAERVCRLQFVAIFIYVKYKTFRNFLKKLFDHVFETYPVGN